MLPALLFHIHPRDWPCFRPSKYKFGAPDESDLTWKPQTTTSINEDQAQTFMKLMDALDDLDDVQNVASNVDITEETMAKLNA